MGGVFLCLWRCPVWSVAVGGLLAPVIAVCALTLGYAGLAGWTIGRFCAISPIRHLTETGIADGFCGALFCLWLAQNQSGNITTIALPFGLALP